jgi:hypothetical protein
MVVFRPFIGEVLVGKVRTSTPQGIHGVFWRWWCMVVQALAEPWLGGSGQCRWASLTTSSSRRVTCRTARSCTHPVALGRRAAAGAAHPAPPHWHLTSRGRCCARHGVGRSDQEEQVWVWHYGGHKLYLDADEVIRFRVQSEAFVDTAPPPTGAAAASGAAAGSTPAGGATGAATAGAGGGGGGASAAAAAAGAGADAGGARRPSSVGDGGARPAPYTIHVRVGGCARTASPPCFADPLAQGFMNQDGLGAVSWWPSG